jgi:hypothetical protein
MIELISELSLKKIKNWKLSQTDAIKYSFDSAVRMQNVLQNDAHDILAKVPSQLSRPAASITTAKTVSTDAVLNERANK